jgi:hypothetical protein
MARRFFYDFEFMEEPGFLEMISIGVVDERGEREFLAINEDADFSRANDWVKENVLPKLPPREKFMGRPLRWMGREKMREALLNFMRPSETDPIELWGYYADYDHVLMCWIFGRMIDLPEGMPWFTLDIKQEMVRMGVKRSELPPDPEQEHNALADARWNREAWKRLQSIKAQRGF